MEGDAPSKKSALFSTPPIYSIGSSVGFKPTNNTTLRPHSIGSLFYCRVQSVTIHSHLADEERGGGLFHSPVGFLSFFIACYNNNTFALLTFTCCTRSFSVPTEFKMILKAFARLMILFAVFNKYFKKVIRTFLKEQTEADAQFYSAVTPTKNGKQDVI